MKQVCRFLFDDDIESNLIEAEITQAILTAEDVFGQPKVRLSASYLVSKNKAVIDVTDEVGEHIARVFTGRMSRKVGQERFTVDRINSKD
ncbi:MAG: hypothetical protein JNN05_03180 [Candidatus Omnitrophica bacterium]|nr:hypothetical protein [Candidatus Omnitrophota bacterium]